jgi:hypothetical protein
MHEEVFSFLATQNAGGTLAVFWRLPGSPRAAVFDEARCVGLGGDSSSEWR